MLARRHAKAEMTGLRAVGGHVTGARLIGPTSMGPLAIAVMAVGAVAIGRLAIGRAVIRTLKAGEGVEVSPGQAHQAMNRSGADVRFVVTSQPPSHGDRVED